MASRTTRSSVVSRVDLLRTELEEVGVDTFCARRIFREDMPLKLMRKLRSADLVAEHDLHRVKAARNHWGPRRRQVLLLLAEGLEDREIAARMTVSIHTVKSNVKVIYALLGARSRAHAVHLAHQQGEL